jgi:hypothetical protein
MLSEPQRLINGIIVNWKSAQKPDDDNPTQALARRSPCQRTCAARKSRDRLPPMKKAGGLVLLDFVAVDSTRGPAPVRSERQGAKLCAIETILRRIRKSTKPAV